jgi:hypothetical protein
MDTPNDHVLQRNLNDDAVGTFPNLQLSVGICRQLESKAFMKPVSELHGFITVDGVGYLMDPGNESQEMCTNSEYLNEFEQLNLYIGTPVLGHPFLRSQAESVRSLVSDISWVLLQFLYQDRSFIRWKGRYFVQGWVIRWPIGIQLPGTNFNFRSSHLKDMPVRSKCQLATITH